MNIVIAAMESVCLAIMLVVLYGLLFENKIKNKKSQIFTVCMVLTVIALGLDIPCWIFDGRTDMPMFLDIINLLALLVGAVLVACYGYYELEIINEKREKKLSVWFMNTISILAGVCDFSIIVLHIFGLIFNIEDGFYKPGPFYSLSALFCGAMIVYLLVLLLFNAKYLGRHDTISLASYIIIPMIGTVIELFVPEITLSFITMSLAAMVLFVTLQSGQVEALHMRGELLNEMSYKDSLTGLLNRRAYSETLSAAPQDTVAGVIFCDVNGLKYANDHMGHQAGDKLLLDFTALLKKNFSADCIYRISGDEFVVVIFKLGEEAFDKRVEKFKKEAFDSNEIASVGHAHGDSSRIMQLLKSAEDHMYAEKQEFYVRHPQYARR